MTVAHEFIHRNSKLDRAMGVAVLASSSYMHFRIAHVYTHHKWVGTPKDPASATQGQNVYDFCFKSVFVGFLNAFKLRPALISFYILVTLALYCGIEILFGTQALLVFAGQSFVAIALLEITNYIEHYGLSRKEISTGIFEPVQARHSWDTTRGMTNWFTFNLGRHSDHHLKPLKTYESLVINDESPKMPAGYSAMVLLALIPYFWRKVMDSKLNSL